MSPPRFFSDLANHIHFCFILRALEESKRGLEFARKRLEQAKVSFFFVGCAYLLLGGHSDFITFWIFPFFYLLILNDEQISNEETVTWKNSLCDQLHLLVRDSNRFFLLAALFSIQFLLALNLRLTNLSKHSLYDALQGTKPKTDVCGRKL